MHILPPPQQQKPALGDFILRFLFIYMEPPKSLRTGHLVESHWYIHIESQPVISSGYLGKKEDREEEGPKDP